MAVEQCNGFLRQLRGVILAQEANGLSDAQLVEAFFARGDEAAFAALVRRHGPMVLGVCQRVLHDWCDAEDAFQATFLVFVRKAAALRDPQHVGNWLYGVAYRTALRARAERLRQRTFVQPALDRTCPEPVAELVWQELRPILDEELNRLPERYRTPLVLCYLEGKTKRQAARQLGRPEGTVSTQLARGRDILRQRLTRRGLSLSAGVLTAALSQQTATAAVSGTLLASTVQAGLQVAAGKAAVGGAIAAPVAALTEGVLRAMLLTKIKLVAAVLLIVGLAAGGAGGLVHSSVATMSPPVTAITLAQAPAKVPGRDFADDRQNELRRDLRDQFEQAKMQVQQAEANLQAAEAQRKVAEASLVKLREALKQQEARVREERDLRQLESQSRDTLRAFQDIERAIKQLKQNAAEDRNKAQAVDAFAKAFQRLRERFDSKAGGGDLDGQRKTPFLKGEFDPFEDQSGPAPINKGGGFAGGGLTGGGLGSGGLTGGGLSGGSFTPGTNPFGGGFSGGAGSGGGSYRGKDPAAEKYLQDARERIKLLEERLEKYEKKANTDAKDVEWNAPPDNLQGTVRAIAKDGLLRISMGGDKGLHVGHTLEVYRLKPQPVYLGRIQLVEVQSDEAVGKLIQRKADAPVQVGDHVTDSLIQK